MTLPTKTHTLMRLISLGGLDPPRSSGSIRLQQGYGDRFWQITTRDQGQMAYLPMLRTEQHSSWRDFALNGTKCLSVISLRRLLGLFPQRPMRHWNKASV